RTPLPAADAPPLRPNRGPAGPARRRPVLRDPARDHDGRGRLAAPGAGRLAGDPVLPVVAHDGRRHRGRQPGDLADGVHGARLRLATPVGPRLPEADARPVRVLRGEPALVVDRPGCPGARVARLPAALAGLHPGLAQRSRRRRRLLLDRPGADAAASAGGMGDLDAATVEPARMIAVGRAAVFPALALLTAYLIFIGGGWAGIYWVQLRILSLALGSALLVTWGVVAWRDASWRPRSRLPAVLVVGLGAMLVSTAFSRQPRLGFDYLAYAVLLVAFYMFLVRVLAHPFFRGRFMDLVAMLAAVLGIAYVVQVVGTWIEWWGLIGGFAPPPLRPAFAGLGYGNPNAVMAVSILLTAPAVAHVGFGSRRRAAISSVLV